MRSIFSIIQIIAFIFIFGNCDDGRIYPEETEGVSGGKGTMEVSFRNESAWPQEYILVFAAFGEDERMPVVSKIISQPTISGDKVSVTLNGLDERTKRLSIAVVNKGRELLYEFYSYPVDDPSDEVILPVSEIDLAKYDRIQYQVFDAYCIRCHGAGEQAAAELDLTTSHSYEALVNKKSVLSEEGHLLVSLVRPGQSFLYEILQDDIVRYNHTDVLPEAELIDLIYTWIANGANE